MLLTKTNPLQNYLTSLGKKNSFETRYKNKLIAKPDHNLTRSVPDICDLLLALPLDYQPLSNMLFYYIWSEHTKKISYDHFHCVFSLFKNHPFVILSFIVAIPPESAVKLSGMERANNRILKG